MRAPLAVALPLLLSGCFAHAHFQAAVPEQAVQGRPEAASAETAGVRIMVHAGNWQGSPEDLEDYLTPVEVFIENGSGRELAVGSEHFTLVSSDGFRYLAMEPRDVQRVIGPRYGGSVVFFGSGPWWGWYGPSFGYWVAVPPDYPQPPAPRGSLRPGGSVAVLLFFPVPSLRLTGFELTANLVDVAGNQLGTITVPMHRVGAAQGPPRQRASGPPPAERPPAGIPPPPTAPPPPPPGTPPPPPSTAPPGPDQPAR